MPCCAVASGNKLFWQALNWIRLWVDIHWRVYKLCSGHRRIFGLIFYSRKQGFFWSTFNLTVQLDIHNLSRGLCMEARRDFRHEIRLFLNLFFSLIRRLFGEFYGGFRVICCEVAYFAGRVENSWLRFSFSFSCCCVRVFLSKTRIFSVARQILVDCRVLCLLSYVRGMADLLLNFYICWHFSDLQLCWRKPMLILVSSDVALWSWSIQKLNFFELLRWKDFQKFLFSPSRGCIVLLIRLWANSCYSWVHF